MKIDIKKADAKKLARLLMNHVSFEDFPFASRVYDELIKYDLGLGLYDSFKADTEPGAEGYAFLIKKKGKHK